MSWRTSSPTSPPFTPSTVSFFSRIWRSAWENGERQSEGGRQPVEECRLFFSHQEQLTDLRLSLAAGRPRLVSGISCRSSRPFSRCTPSTWRISIKLWSCWNSGPTALLNSRPPFRRYRYSQKCRLGFWKNRFSQVTCEPKVWAVLLTLRTLLCLQ